MQKKQKLIIIQSKIKILQVVKMMNESHLTFI